jgi:hypothetical protein
MDETAVVTIIVSPVFFSQTQIAGIRPVVDGLMIAGGDLKRRWQATSWGGKTAVEPPCED